MVLNLTIFAYLGPTSPFLLYTLGTPLLAGVLFRTTGAVLLGGGMFVGYYALVALSGSGLQELRAPCDRDIQALVVLPALYPLAAAAGAAVRSLLDRQAATQAALPRWPRAGPPPAPSARGSRARCTTRWARRSTGSRSPPEALSHRDEQGGARRGRRRQRELSSAAQVAAEEARGLISDLRSDTLDLPLGDALDRYVREWSRPLRDRRPPAGRRRRPASSGHAL